MLDLSFKEDFSKEEVVETLKEIRHPFEIAIVNSKNPFNVGGIIRSHHCFLGRHIHLIEDQGFYKKGAVATLKYEKSVMTAWDKKESFVAANRHRNIVAFERRENLQSKDIRGYQYPDHPILLFGCENTGIPDDLLEIAKDVVSIPVFGLQLDFNLCTAASIAMFDFVNKYYSRNK